VGGFSDETSPLLNHFDQDIVYYPNQVDNIATAYGAVTVWSSPPSDDPLQQEFDLFDTQFRSGKQIMRVSGACGTGKTILFPKHVMKSTSMKMIILIPRRLAVANAYSFYSQDMKVFARYGCEDHSNCSFEDADLIILTTGAAVNQLKRLKLSSYLVMIDEAHDELWEVDVVFDYLRQAGAKICLVSATLPGATFPYKKKNSQTWVMMPFNTSKSGSFTNNLRSRYLPELMQYMRTVANGPMAIVGASIGHAREFISMSTFNEEVIEVSSKGVRFIPNDAKIDRYGNKIPFMDTKKPLVEDILRCMKLKPEALIATTNVIEVGVTIPGLSGIVDLGERFSVQISGYDLENKTEFDVTLLKAAREPATVSMVTQVSGRVSRQEPGVAFIMNCDNLSVRTGRSDEQILLEAEARHKNGMNVRDDIQEFIKCGNPLMITSTRSFIHKNSNSAKKSEREVQDVAQLEQAQRIQYYLEACQRLSRSRLNLSSDAPKISLDTYMLHGLDEPLPRPQHELPIVPKKALEALTQRTASDRVPLLDSRLYDYLDSSEDEIESIMSPGMWEMDEKLCQAELDRMNRIVSRSNGQSPMKQKDDYTVGPVFGSVKKQEKQWCSSCRCRVNPNGTCGAGPSVGGPHMLKGKGKPTHSVRTTRQQPSPLNPTDMIEVPSVPKKAEEVLTQRTASDRIIYHNWPVLIVNKQRLFSGPVQGAELVDEYWKENRKQEISDKRVIIDRPSWCYSQTSIHCQAGVCEVCDQYMPFNFTTNADSALCGHLPLSELQIWRSKHCMRCGPKIRKFKKTFENGVKENRDRCKKIGNRVLAIALEYNWNREVPSVPKKAEEDSTQRTASDELPSVPIVELPIAVWFDEYCLEYEERLLPLCGLKQSATLFNNVQSVYWVIQEPSPTLKQRCMAVVNQSAAKHRRWQKKTGSPNWPKSKTNILSLLQKYVGNEDEFVDAISELEYRRWKYGCAMHWSEKLLYHLELDELVERCCTPIKTKVDPYDGLSPTNVKEDNKIGRRWPSQHIYKNRWSLKKRYSGHGLILPSTIHPSTEGYCYLRLVPNYSRWQASKLGPNPTVKQLRESKLVSKNPRSIKWNNGIGHVTSRGKNHCPFNYPDHWKIGAKIIAHIDGPELSVDVSRKCVQLGTDSNGRKIQAWSPNSIVDMPRSNRLYTMPVAISSLPPIQLPLQWSITMEPGYNVLTDNELSALQCPCPGSRHWDSSRENELLAIEKELAEIRDDFPDKSGGILSLIERLRWQRTRRRQVTTALVEMLSIDHIVESPDFTLHNYKTKYGITSELTVSSKCLISTTTHADFASIVNCSTSCHHTHSDFSNKQNCSTTCGHDISNFPCNHSHDSFSLSCPGDVTSDSAIMVRTTKTVRGRRYINPRAVDYNGIRNHCHHGEQIVSPYDFPFIRLDQDIRTRHSAGLNTHLKVLDSLGMREAEYRLIGVKPLKAAARPRHLPSWSEDFDGKIVPTTYEQNLAMRNHPRIKKFDKYKGARLPEGFYPVPWFSFTPLMTCCKRGEFKDEFIIAYSNTTFLTIYLTGPFIGISYLERHHTIRQSVLPFISLRGVPIYATLPYHAHGMVVDSNVALSKPLEILTDKGKKQYIDSDRWLELARLNCRNLGKAQHPPIRKCPLCAREMWLHLDRCAICVSTNEFPQLPVTSDIVIAKIHRNYLMKSIFTKKTSKSKTIEIPKSVEIHWLNAIIVMDDCGKTLLFKSYPQWFNTAHHQREYQGKRERLYMSAYDHHDKILLASPFAEANYPYIRYLGAASLILRKNFESHNIDWQEQDDAVRRLGLTHILTHNINTWMAAIQTFARQGGVSVHFDLHRVTCGCGRYILMPKQMVYSAIMDQCPCGRIISERKLTSSGEHSNRFVEIRSNFPAPLASEVDDLALPVLHHTGRLGTMSMDAKVNQPYSMATDGELMWTRNEPEHKLALIKRSLTSVLPGASSIKLYKGAGYVICVAGLPTVVMAVAGWDGTKDLIPYIPKIEPILEWGSAVVHNSMNLVIQHQDILTKQIFNNINQTTFNTMNVLNITYVISSSAGDQRSASVSRLMDINVIGAFIQLVKVPPSLVYGILAVLLFIKEWSIQIFWSVFSLTSLSLLFAIVIPFIIWHNIWGYKYNPAPEVLPENPNYLYSSSNEPHKDSTDIVAKFYPPNKQLLMVTIGTRGDHVPIQYYCRLAAWLGIPVHNYRIQDGDQETLNKLRAENFDGLRAAFMRCFTTHLKGYRAVYQPLTSNVGQVKTFSLFNTSNYVNPIKFGERKTLTSQCAWLGAHFFSPTFYIGSCRDQQLPRSADGVSLLKKYENKKQVRQGIFWLEGSDQGVIPLHLKALYPPIKQPYHHHQFRSVKKVHFHGGAGTLHTLLMNGVQVEKSDIHDDNIDRDYHRIPTVDDVIQRGPMAFIGSLIMDGFPMYKLSFPVRLYALFCYALTQSHHWLPWLAIWPVRAYLCWNFMTRPFLGLMLVFFSIPELYELSLSSLGYRGTRWTIRLILKFPYLFAASYISAGLVTWLALFDVFSKCLNEYFGMVDNKASLVIRRVEGFPLPFGHVFAKNNQTQEIFEGAFVDIRGFGERFNTRVCPNVLRKVVAPIELGKFIYSLVGLIMALIFVFMLNSMVYASFLFVPFIGIIALIVLLCACPILAACNDNLDIDEIEIPVPFNFAELKHIVKSGKYSAGINCLTFLVPHAYSVSYISATMLLLLTICSMAVLIPGQLCDYFYRKTKITFGGLELVDCQFVTENNINLGKSLSPFNWLFIPRGCNHSPKEVPAQTLSVRASCRDVGTLTNNSSAKSINAQIKREMEARFCIEKNKKTKLRLCYQFMHIMLSSFICLLFSSLYQLCYPFLYVWKKWFGGQTIPLIAQEQECVPKKAHLEAIQRTASDVSSQQQSCSFPPIFANIDPISNNESDVPKKAPVGPTQRTASDGLPRKQKVIIEEVPDQDTPKVSLSDEFNHTMESFYWLSRLTMEPDEIENKTENGELIICKDDTFSFDKKQADFFFSKMMLQAIKDGGPKGSGSRRIMDRINNELQSAEAKAGIKAVPVPPGPFSTKSPDKSWVVDLMIALGKLRDYASFYMAGILTQIMQYVELRFALTYSFGMQLYHAIGFILQTAWEGASQAISNLVTAATIIIEAIFGQSDARRLKTSWALAGFWKDPFLSYKRRFEELEVEMHAKERGDFLEDFEDIIKQINDCCRARGAPEVEMAPQFRKIRWNKPVLTKEQADYLGMGPDDYDEDTLLTERIENFRKHAPVSADPVYMNLNTDLLRRSVGRYEPQYIQVLSAEMESLADQIADALVDQYPSSHEKMKVSTPRQVAAYYKTKYAAGSPWISMFKTRQELVNAGIDEALFDLMEKKFASGEYPMMFHKAFMKSQVVSLEAIRYKGKNVRTVVAEELLTYFMNMCMELERNSRHNWKETGLGIGMPMNQNMIHLFQKLHEAKIDGGIFAEADAHEYDSRTGPFNKAVLSRFATRGFKDHPNCASVLHAKYDVLQKSYIFSETAQNHKNSITILVDSKSIATHLRNLFPTTTITYDELQSCQTSPYDCHKKFQEDYGHPIHDLYRNKVILHDQQDDLFVLNKYGVPVSKYLSYVFTRATLRDDIPPLQSTDIKVFNSISHIADWLSTVKDNIHLLYNVVHKNRGGGTGENATSWDNGWGYKAAFIAAWMKYFDFKFTADEFFSQGNVLYNTGDDSAIVLKVDPKTFDKQKFINCAHDFDIDLDFDFFTRLSDVNYLGKSIRKPLDRDQKDLEAWQKMCMNEDKSRNPGQEPEARVLPRWIVYQRIRESWIRQSSNNYFKNSSKNRQYIHAYMQKQAGTANIAVFNRQLWDDLAANHCIDAERLSKYYRVNGFQCKVLMDQFELPYVDYQMPHSIRTPRQVRKFIKDHPSYLPSRQEQFGIFLETCNFPRYARSLKNALKTDELYDSDAEHDALWAKIDYKTKYRYMELGNLFLDVTKEYIGGIPRAVYKMQPTILPALGDTPFVSTTYTVEWFVYKMKNPKTLSEFLSLISRSPYSSVTNAATFWSELQDPEFKAKGMATPVHIYGSKIVAGTLLYASLFFLEKELIRVPFLGFAYKFLLFMLLDMPKLYSLVSSIVWHATADSNPVVSSIMPKDPYIWAKRLAMACIDILPDQLFTWTPLGYTHFIVREASKITVMGIEALCGLLRYAPKPADDISPVHQIANPWKALVSENSTINRKSNDRVDFLQPVPHSLAPRTTKKTRKPLVIKSELATGKSSMLPYALLNNPNQLDVMREIGFTHNNGRIVICFPRKVLVEQWTSPYSGSAIYPVHKFKAGKNIPRETRIILITDGSAIHAIQQGLLKASDYYLLDEFHELNGQKVALFQTILQRGYACSLLSATPVSLPGVEVNFYETPLPRRFVPEVYEYPDGMAIADVYKQFVYGRKEWSGQAEKMLIKTTYLTDQKDGNGVNQIREAFEYEQMTTHTLHSGNASESIPTDIQCIIATGVINAGISIPGRRLLISDGKMHSEHEGVHSQTWSDATTEYQVNGRVGRYGKGDIVLRPHSAGTGTTPRSYTSLSYLQYHMNASLLHLPQLISYTDFRLSPYLKSQFTFYDELPYIGINNVTIPFNYRGYVAIYHALYASGVSDREIQSIWTKFFTYASLEDYEWLIPLRDRMTKGLMKIDLILSYANTEGSTLYLCCNRTSETGPAKAPRVSHDSTGLLQFITTIPKVDEFYIVAPSQPLIPLKRSLRPMADARVILKGRLDTPTVVPQFKTIEESYQYLETKLHNSFVEQSTKLIDIAKSAFAKNPQKLAGFKHIIRRLEENICFKQQEYISEALNKPDPSRNLPPGVHYQGPSFGSPLHSFSQFSNKCYLCDQNHSHIHYQENTKKLPSDLMVRIPPSDNPLFYQYFQSHGHLVEKSDKADRVLIDLPGNPLWNEVMTQLPVTEGAIMCKHRQPYIIGESGPNRKTNNSGHLCPMSCMLTSSGDHILPPDAIVLARGSNWARTIDECRVHNARLIISPDNTYGVGEFAQLRSPD
jgi:hypothetical protein